MSWRQNVRCWGRCGNAAGQVGILRVKHEWEEGREMKMEDEMICWLVEEFSCATPIMSCHNGVCKKCDKMLRKHMEIILDKSILEKKKETGKRF